MNITQIKYVLEVAKSSSIRGFNKTVCFSAGLLSASMRDLENESGDYTI